MRRKSTSNRAVTLIEVLVSAGLLGLVMTAVLSFYVEAVAVSAKRDEQSTRLRRFHIGLDKMEQLLREGRVMKANSRSIVFLKLSPGSELDGFPLYDDTPAQLASTEKGVLLIQDGVEQNLLPTESGENILFGWVQEQPGADPAMLVLNIALHYSGEGKRSDLFFHRTLNVQRY